MHLKAVALQARTHAFFMNVIALCEALPSDQVTRSIAPELLGSAGSLDSNYREACRGRSTREFIAKIGIAMQEADETKGWLLALRDAGKCPSIVADRLIDEADQLTAILTKSHKTASQNLARRRQAATLPPRRRR